MGSIDYDTLAELYRGKPPEVRKAFDFQRRLKGCIIGERSFGELKKVAGADISILKSEKKLICGIIVFSYPDMTEIERVYSEVDENFPYIPGLLAFREGPAIIETYGKLSVKPDVLILDGQGTAHPRGVGIACHVGVLLDVPAMGIGKSRLYGSFEEPGTEKGAWTPLTSREGERIGAVLRTKDRTKPVFVSPGHRIDLESALEIALTCSRGLRIPEPTRLADTYVAELKKGRK
ncbi:MAG: endonuclease V [Candidatus Dadabacteria bacterium]|nr:endonuclease V [Candidatus Dadabacteria bacterium]